ncbi:hypothetical protein [Nostoc sp. 106C]
MKAVEHEIHLNIDQALAQLE